MMTLFDVFFLQEITMNRVRYVHWQEEDFHLGYFALARLMHSGGVEVVEVDG